MDGFFRLFFVVPPAHPNDDFWQRANATRRAMLLLRPLRRLARQRQGYGPEWRHQRRALAVTGAAADRPLVAHEILGNERADVTMMFLHGMLARRANLRGVRAAIT